MVNARIGSYSASGVRRRRQVALKRKRLLAGIIRLVDEGRRADAVPFLLSQCAKDPDLLGVRLVDVTMAVYECGRQRALSDLAEADRVCGERGLGGRLSMVTVGDCLKTQRASYRLVAWLWALCERHEHARLMLPDGFPYGLLYK